MPNWQGNSFLDLPVLPVPFCFVSALPVPFSFCAPILVLLVYFWGCSSITSRPFHFVSVGLAVPFPHLRSFPFRSRNLRPYCSAPSGLGPSRSVPSRLCPSVPSRSGPAGPGSVHPARDRVTISTTIPAPITTWDGRHQRQACQRLLNPSPLQWPDGSAPV